MKKKIIPILIILLILGLVGGCYYMTTPVQGVTEEVEFKVTGGEDARTIIKNLKKAGLIRSEYFTLLYIKLNNSDKHPISLKKGDYVLDKSDSLRTIITTLNSETGAKSVESKKVTFVEGSTIEDIAKKIANVYELDVNEVIAKLDDPTFIQSLIDDKEITIVTQDILKQGVRHPLEGYLYCDTYQLAKDATVEEIAKKLVKTTNDRFMKAAEKTDYKKNGWTNYHDVITLASIVELEGPSRNAKNYKDELQGVAEVFLNRLYVNMTLGSDVTTYYSVRKRIGSDTLYAADFKVCDGYNTRGTCVPGLPVGAICSPSYDSIEAVMNGLFNPKYKDYYYFVADKNTNIHFSKSDAEQQKVIKELKNQGLWLEE